MVHNAQCHFSGRHRMDAAMFRLVAALLLSEALKSGAHLELEKVRHQVHLLGPWHIILVTA